MNATNKKKSKNATRDRYWYCLIGPVPKHNVPKNADLKPRIAARNAIECATGRWPDCASGWIESHEAKKIMEARRES